MRERTGSRLTAFELMPRFGLDLQLKHKMIPARVRRRCLAVTWRGRRPGHGRTGLNATPLVVGDVVIIGAAHRPGAIAADACATPRATCAGYDARTGRRLWIFHTIPRPGEVGYDTWLESSAENNGNTGAWSQMSADAALGLVYVPVEMPTGDYYGGNRPGNTLFGESLVALDVKTGRAEVALPDGASRAVGLRPSVRADPLRHHGQRPARSRPWHNRRSRRSCSSSIAKRVNRSGRSRNGPSPSPPHPRNARAPRSRFRHGRLPFDRQGVGESDLLDLTPALKAEAIEVAKRYRMGPLFTPPIVSSLDGPLATLQVPSDVGGANWPGGAMDPETNVLFIHSHTAVFLNGLVPANPAPVGHGLRVRAGPGRRRRAECGRARGWSQCPAAAARPFRACRC